MWLGNFRVRNAFFLYFVRIGLRANIYLPSGKLCREPHVLPGLPYRQTKLIFGDKDKGFAPVARFHEFDLCRRKRMSDKLLRTLVPLYNIYLLVSKFVCNSHNARAALANHRADWVNALLAGIDRYFCA